MPRSSVMAEKMRTALHIEEPKPFIHPKSRKLLPKATSAKAASTEATRVHVVASPPPAPPPPPAVQVEPPRPRRSPVLDQTTHLRNSAKDRRNILATELEGYRKQETRLKAELAEVEQHITIRMEEVRHINESLEFLDLTDSEVQKLDDYLSKHRGKAPHQSSPGVGPYYKSMGATLSSSEVMEYMKLNPGKDVTLRECRDFFNITDPKDVRCRDLAIRFNYLLNQGNVVRISQGTYRLAPMQ